MPKRLSTFNGSRDGHPTTAKRPKPPANNDLNLAIRVPSPGQRTHYEYTVGVICALVCESVAFQAFFDETHDRPTNRQCHDSNDYTLGRIGEHNVVLAVLPGGVYGTTSAAAAAQDLKRSFPSVEFGLMVGLGGGAPNENNDIRLGDVVVSRPENGRGGVFQYDFGKMRQGQAFDTTGSFLNQPPNILLSAVNGLQSQYRLHGNQLANAIKEVLQQNPGLKQEYKRPSATSDRLYRSDIMHPVGSQASCKIVCSKDLEALASRPERPKGAYSPTIHYGLIASANTLMRDALARDKLAEEEGVLCFEMEAAGLMNNWPCLVIRGICDYADTHKNKEWQGYAAMTAAAYARDLLRRIPRLAEANDQRSANDLSIQVPSRSDEAYQDIKEQRRLVLNALKFDKMNDRHETIRNGHAKTCKWLLQTNEYRSWLDPNQLDNHLGFLWMKGKPGAGKSKLMKFLYTNAQRTMKNRIILSFFFNARGVDLEKSTIGMYRHLLRQLLEKLPKLLDVFNTSEISIPLNQEWSIESLKAIMEQAILRLDKSQVACFIDALDECAEDEVRDMISFFEQLSKKAVSRGIGFQICFASRLYPTISIEKSVTFDLQLQDGHGQDITSYIETELRIGKSILANEVRAEVEKKASGVFLWVCLVVQILNKTADTGQIEKLKRKLREIPGTLHDLFRDILQRDKDNGDKLLLCLQWVLFAARPLEPAELYFAIQSGTGPEFLSLWNAGEITPSIINRFILNASKGLTELTISETPTVQFIHESVRDFLLKENGLRDNWFDPGQDICTESHERLKNCCLDYINSDAVTAVQTDESRKRGTLRQVASVRDSVEAECPFLRYAVGNIFHHANLAANGGGNQTTFLQNFPCAKWIQIDNLYQQAIDRHHDASLLYILAERNLGGLIRHHPQIQSCFELEKERYATPIFAALGRRADEAIRAILETLVERQGFAHPTDNLCERYYADGHDVPDFRKHPIFSERKYHEILKRSSLLPREYKNIALDYLYELDNEVIMHAFLIAYNFENMHVQASYKSPLFWAVSRGKKYLVERMLDKGADINSFQLPPCSLRLPWTPLCSAAAAGQDAMIIFLLEKGASTARTRFSESPVHLAARHGHQSTSELLLERGFNIHDKIHRTIISSAVQSGSQSMVRFLLNKGALIDCHDEVSSRTPLMHAAESGNTPMCKLLVANGASVTSKDSENWTPLFHAICSSDADCVKYLIQQGAEIESRDHIGRTPLCFGAERSTCHIVQILLESGADLASRDDDGRTPLSHAALGYERRVAVIKLLLECGADIESKDSSGRTPLSIASVGWARQNIIRFLLDCGAKIESRDSSGRTPLSQAASGTGSGDNIRLLLDNGANVESKDLSGRTPLSWAASDCYKDINTRLFLQRGANIESRDKSGRTPLSWATSNGQVQIVRLLLRNGADPGINDNWESSPLRLAHENNRHEVIKDLLKAKAKAVLKNN